MLKTDGSADELHQSTVYKKRVFKNIFSDQIHMHLRRVQSERTELKQTERRHVISIHFILFQFSSFLSLCTRLMKP